MTILDKIFGVKSIDEVTNDMINIVNSFDESTNKVGNYPVYNLMEGKSIVAGRNGDKCPGLRKEFASLKDEANKIVLEYNKNGSLETEHLYAKRLNKFRKEMQSTLNSYEYICNNFWDRK